MNSRRLRRTQLVGLMVLVVLVAASWYFLLGPRFGEPDTIQDQVAATLDQKSLIDQQTLALQRRQRYLPVAEQEVNSLDAKFPAPEDADAASLGLAMSEAAEGAGITESAITLSIADPQPVTPADGQSTDPNQPAPSPAPEQPVSPGAAPTVQMSAFSITAVGSASQLGDFMTNLHDLPQALALDDVAVAFSLQPGTGAPGAAAVGTYTLTVKGRAFYLSAIPSVPDNLRSVTPAAEPSPAASPSSAP